MKGTDNLEPILQIFKVYREIENLIVRGVK
jgi:hypothetical protein